MLCSINYAGCWTANDVKELKKQYLELADFYYELTRKEEKFYLSPFEVKLSSHIQGASYCHERCELGEKQISVSWDGGLYPCTQFVNQPAYCIGHVQSGIHQEKRMELYKSNEEEKAECKGCAAAARCNCHCGCLNQQAAGSIQRVPVILCEHERMLLRIADKLGARLYKEKNGMFIQKHYNDIFPILSLVEDMKR